MKKRLDSKQAMSLLLPFCLNSVVELFHLSKWFWNEANQLTFYTSFWKETFTWAKCTRRMKTRYWLKDFLLFQSIVGLETIKSFHIWILTLTSLLVIKESPFYRFRQESSILLANSSITWVSILKERLQEDDFGRNFTIKLVILK